MRRAYRLLLQLYPREHRLQFAEEMLAVFTLVAEERRAQGSIAYLRFVMNECFGLLRGACVEWLKRISLAPVLGGIVVAAILHAGFYVAAWKCMHTVRVFVDRSAIAPADPRAAGLTLAILSVAILLCLLPIVVLLSLRLTLRRR
jgi:hypothetical protein